jgi:hypothetical protein
MTLAGPPPELPDWGETEMKANSNSFPAEVENSGVANAPLTTWSTDIPVGLMTTNLPALAVPALVVTLSGPLNAPLGTVT